MKGSVQASLFLVAVALSFLSVPLWVLWRVVVERHVAFPGVASGVTGAEAPLWFVQVSDVHLSRFRAVREAQAIRFADEVLPTIQPATVVVTGDLTDAKDASHMRSEQHDDEWRAYRSLVERMSMHAPVLDLRGNHDAFGVRSRTEMHSPFSRHAASGRDGYFVSNGDNDDAKTLVRTVDIADRGHRLRVVMVDFTPHPGANRPFNFFGRSSEETEEALRDALHRPFAPPQRDTATAAAQASTSGSVYPEHTFVFGHYPLTTVRQKTPTMLASLLSGTREDGSPLVTAYMCGHLHTLLSTLYARHPEGLLELEVGDMKVDQRYRVVVLDHGVFAFSDVHLGQWPVIVPTAPKHAGFLVASDDWRAFLSRGVVRSVVFSPSPVASVTASVDGVPVGALVALSTDGADPMSKVFEARLDWQQLAREKGVNVFEGQHTLVIEARDSNGSSNSVRVPFTSDGHPTRNWRASRALLVSALPTTLYPCLLAVLAALAAIAFFAHFRSTALASRREPSAPAAAQDRGTCSSLCALLDGLCWVWRSRVVLGVLLAHLAFCAFGPWCLAELMEGETGVVFPDHVVHADGTAVYTGDPLVYGCVHAAIILPIALLAFSLGGAWHRAATTQRAPLVKGRSVVAQLAPRILFGWAIPAIGTLYLALALTAFELVEYATPYGLFSVLLAPGAAWGPVVFCGLAVAKCLGATLAECRRVMIRDGRVA